MKKGSRSIVGAVLLSLLLVLAMIPAAVFAERHPHPITQDGGQTTLTPAKDGTRLAETIDKLGGSDGLYGDGLNGFDMYDHLGYVYLGWRTTGGIWQNRVIGDYIMSNLEAAGYATTDANVQAPYGTKPASDKSSATDKDYAWEIQYQGTEDKELGYAWDPEYASLDVQLVNGEGKPVNDADADALARKVSGEYWAYDPETEVYQKNFAELFGLDYDTEIAPLSMSEKLLKMKNVLMTSDVDPDKRTTVDDYTYITRDSIGEPNKEAVLNKRTRLAWQSCFTDPSGTDPAEAAGLDGEIVYVGEIISMSENSEGIPNEDLEGKIILTDSSMYRGYYYATKVGAVGAASKKAMDAYLCPKDEDGKILEPWYDSSRYQEGCEIDQALEQMDEGKPVVEWQFSNRQYDSLKALLEKAKEINEAAGSDADKVKVTGRQIAIGQIYPMTKTEGKPGVGQAVAIAEVKGSVHPEKRVIICAHVQEPGCGDNATGVASLLSMAMEYKKLVDAGKIDRPKCTITFMWGDEMNMASYWMDGHPEEKANLIGALDMDMTGQDPDKTGGVMRIEKTPDPSVNYGYDRDAVPWDEPDKSIPSKSNPYYDDTYRDSEEGEFVRLPDSDTLWGAGWGAEEFDEGWYLNDLYMYVTSTVIDRHDEDFRVDVCPYEGGSDHSTFQKENIPALLTWHFTDYNYHTSSDTLYMASPREMESVGLTTLACALMMGDTCQDADAAADILGAVKEAGLKRMDVEAVNTDHHLIYAKAGHAAVDEALSNEKEVLGEWGAWYDAALGSVATLFDGTSDALNKAIEDAKAEMSTRTQESLQYADTVFTAKEKPDNGLPVVYIDVDESDVTINDMLEDFDHKVTCTGKMSIDVPDGFHYSDFPKLSCESVEGLDMTIRGRGNTTWENTPKKPFKIKLGEGTDIFGLGTNKHWVLLANLFDSTLLKDRITGWLGDKMGFEFTPRGVPVDLVLTGSKYGSRYLGSYYLSENVRVDTNRLDMEKPKKKATEMPDISGGYLLQIGTQVTNDSPDKFYTKRGVVWATDTPTFDTSDDDGYDNPAQQQYIQGHMQEIEDALFGDGFRNEDGKHYSDLMDVENAALYWLLNTVTYNGDAYVTGSTYVYKKRDTDKISKLYWGPLWDFDYAWNHAPYTEGFFIPREASAEWVKAMLYDTADGGFVKTAQSQWTKMETALKELTAEGGVIDKYCAETKASAEIDHEIYKDWFIEVGDQEEGEIYDYEKEVKDLKDWIDTRTEWVHNNLGALDNIVHKVSFYVDGKYYDSRYVTHEDFLSIYAVKPPEKEGYLLLGWGDGKGNIFDGTSQIKADKTLYAEYVKEEDATHGQRVVFPNDNNIILYNLHAPYFSIPYTVLPTDAQYQAVEWSSSDESLATISEEGIANLTDPGDTGSYEVTFTAKLKYSPSVSEFHLKVLGKNGELPELQSVSPAKDPIEMVEGSEEIAAIVTDPSPTNVRFYAYMSENTDIVTVDPITGVITAKAPGETKVHVEAGVFDDSGRIRKFETEMTVRVSAKPSVKSAKVTGLGTKTYTGKAIKPKVKVKLDGKTLTAGTDYKLEYSNYKKVGKAKIKITGIGNYGGSKTVSFKIRPKSTKIVSRTGLKGGFKVKWKKRKIQVSGYQVRWSLKSNMSRAKKKLIKTNKKIKFKKTGLKQGRKYYVQVRTYKKVKGKKYYSAWSKKKAVKTK